MFDLFNTISNTGDFQSNTDNYAYIELAEYHLTNHN